MDGDSSIHPVRVSTSHCRSGSSSAQSVENCACVLHNLTFQLEAEAPALFSRISALGRANITPEGDTGPIGCFSPQSRQVLEAEVRREGGREGGRETGGEERTEGQRKRLTGGSAGNRKEGIK